MNIYDFKVLDKAGEEVSLSKYKGKVLLIVNTATRCGFTPTYKDLETLYEEYGRCGFEILDFPCNQFGEQAPEDIETIDDFCRVKYGTTFTRFNKIEVNGQNEDPLYTYLKSKQGFKGFNKEHKLTKILSEINLKKDKNWEKSSDIKWNFTKFLVNVNGEVVARFEPTATIKDLEKVIEPYVSETKLCNFETEKEDKKEIVYSPVKIEKLSLAMMTDCPHCKMAERLLDKANIRYEKINWDTESGEEIIRSLKIKTVPVLLIPTKDGFETVRGEVEINKLIKTGKLQNR
jgi:glutathione peroxidase